MKQLVKIIFCLLAVSMMVSCSSSKTTVAPTKKSTVSSSSSKSSSSGVRVGAVTTGQASYYSDKLHGNKTASGEKYDKRAMTCAHKTYPFGTMLKVTNTSNGKSVTLKVNDRGPFKAGRIVDVSGSAAEKLDMKTAGVVNVKVEIVKLP